MAPCPALASFAEESPVPRISLGTSGGAGNDGNLLGGLLAGQGYGGDPPGTGDLMMGYNGSLHRTVENRR